jgi:outer membrane protein OmpA-like peptidoglycan-associated protein
LNLNEILFESNSAQISEVSFKELERVIDVMVKNPTMKVEISAHTDDVGSEVYNQALSLRRASSVVDYMVANDIPPDRFDAKGYGETRPIFPNDSDENRAKNRRVELKVLEVLN